MLSWETQFSVSLSLRRILRCESSVSWVAPDGELVPQKGCSCRKFHFPQLHQEKKGNVRVGLSIGRKQQQMRYLFNEASNTLLFALREWKNSPGMCRVRWMLSVNKFRVGLSVWKLISYMTPFTKITLWLNWEIPTSCRLHFCPQFFQSQQCKSLQTLSRTLGWA